jgi:hypothetical protein
MSFANIIISVDIAAAVAAVAITWHYVRQTKKQRNVKTS